MSIQSYCRTLAAKVLRRSEIAHDLDEELRSHIEYRVDDLERSGLTRAEAERRARIEFGGQERYKEECHEALGGNFIETFVHDVRFSLRVLRKSPGFTVVAVITLALAIGANAVVFAVLNALILRPLNLPREHSLYGVERGENGFVSYLDYVDVRDRNRSFESLAAFNITEVGVNAGKEPSRAWAFEISGNYFEALGVRPHLGRVLQPTDEHGVNSVPYVVLSYGYWNSHFQSDPDVVGRTVQLNTHPYTIIGVAPPGFRGTLLFLSPDVFVPLVNHDELSANGELNARSKHWLFEMLGHLKPGITPAQATADLNSIGDYLQKTYPKEEPQWKFRLARPSLYGNFLGNPIRAFVAGLMLLAFLILLAACANLGTLFAARASDRSREVALRLALGSTRNRILRQLLTEAVLISLLGGTVGLLGSIVLLRHLSAWQPFPRFPLQIPVNPDANVYTMAVVLALLSGLLFGIVPVRQVLKANPYEVVKAGSSGGVGRQVSVRDVLLVTQIAICAVLVTSSFVAVRGLIRSMHSNFGFEPRDVVLAETDLSMAGYRGEMVPTMQRRMFDALETIPAVKAVGLVDEPPLSMGGMTTTVYSDKTTDMRSSNAAASPWLYKVSPGYFDAAGTALLAGRTFSWHDDDKAPRVAVVNREFAQKLFGSIENGIGKYFKLRDGALVQVVGIVEDGKYFNLAEDSKPAMFFPLLQSPWADTWLLVRSNGDLQDVSAAVRSKLRELDPGLFAYIQPWTTELQGVLFPSRMATLSLGVLGMMGAMLSITGIFGMAAYSVSKRLRELGIRIALGARSEEVLRAALGRALKLLAFGSAAGLILGLLATKVLASIVYQASPRDPMVLAGVIVAMSLLGLLATWIPAQRALSVDPLILLRDE
jgi:predicted permease